MLRSYVVRIYGEQGVRGMVGEVESFTPAFRRPFGDKDELWRILKSAEDNTPRKQRKGGASKGNRGK